MSNCLKQNIFILQSAPLPTPHTKKQQGGKKNPTFAYKKKKLLTQLFITLYAIPVHRTGKYFFENA